MKKLTSMLLILALALSLLTVQTLAAEAAEERGVLTYEEIVAPQYEAALQFSEGLAAVKKDGKWGYIDESGNVAVPFEYDIACVFSEGYGIVGKWIQDDERGRHCYELGFVDKENHLTWFEGVDEDIRYYEQHFPTHDVSRLLIVLEEDETVDVDWYRFYNGYVVLVPYGYDPVSIYDTTGKWLFGFDPRGTVILRPTEGLVPLYSVWNSHSQYYDMNRELVLDLEGISEVRSFNQGMAIAREDGYDSDREKTGLWGFIDTTGKWVIEPKYTEMWVMDFKGGYESFGEGGMTMVSDADGKWGAIDKQGNTVIPLQYEELHTSTCGLASFKENGLWGYLDTQTLEVAIQPQYEEAAPFNDGYAVVQTGGVTQLIDRGGNVIPGTQNLAHDLYFREDGVIYSPEEYVVIQRDGKYGYGRVRYVPQLPTQKDMSGWAFEEVKDSIEEDLVPASLQALYTKNITRADFCRLAVSLLEQSTGKSIEDVVAEKTGKTLDACLHEYPFSDCCGRESIACYALGIVNGRGDGTFDPYASITRQEAAAMLARAASVLGIEPGAAVSFADAGTFPGWARSAINFTSGLTDPISGKAVMGGVGGGNFDPTGTYTREQAYITALRLFHCG